MEKCGEKSSLKVGLNGFGRIGKLFARAVLQKNFYEIVAVNDPYVSPQCMGLWLKYDSVHGKFCCDVKVESDSLMVNESKIQVFNQQDPQQVPWKDLGVDVVVECSGKFTSVKKCEDIYIQSGVKKVILSAPGKEEDTPTFVLGVNHEKYEPTMNVISNASCTTNCLAPLAKLLNEWYGIEEGLMSTIHAVTASQKVVDSASTKNPRFGRAAGMNIIPATTGAAEAVTLAIPELRGKVTGMAFRVPVENVSVVDFTVRLKKPMNSLDEFASRIEEIERNEDNELHGIIGVNREELVSCDFNGDDRSCIVDLKASILLNPNFIKIVAFYDNEWAYALRLVSW
jgi:glyceraldehyde 3-phosphate dehydrogenase